MIFLFLSTLLISLTYSQDTICEETSECADLTLSDTANNIECNGYLACENADLEFNDIFCGGSYGCYGADLYSADDTFCTGELACSDANITTAQFGKVFCQGDNACVDASIVSRTIECNGNEACNGADLTTTVGDRMRCRGDYACVDATLNPGSTFECDGRYACIDVEAVVARTVRCNGWYSCYGAELTSIANNIECEGDNSCRGATLRGNVSNSIIQCFGDLSCAYADLATEANLQCYGHYGCIGSYVNIVSDVNPNGQAEFWGDYSGAYSIVNAENNIGLYQVKANGFYSLLKGYVYSGRNNTLEMEFFGYLAGFKTRVYCEAGSTCNVTCLAFACFRTRVICDTDATCDIDCDQPDSSIYCPTIRTRSISSFIANDKLENIEISKEMSETFELNAFKDEDYKQISKLNKEKEHHEIMSSKGIQMHATFDIINLKNNQLKNKEKENKEESSNKLSKYRQKNNDNNDDMDSFKKDISKNARINSEWWGFWNRITTVNCLEANECRDEELDGTYLYCEGFRSCFGSDLDFSIISCDGYQACKNSTVDGSKVVYCDGDNGCAESTVIAADLFCDGYQGCLESNLTVTDDLLCRGEEACDNANADVDDIVLCDGYLSCQEATITSTDYISCNGEQSCNDATLTTNSYLLCEGDNACDGATISSDTDVFCDGLRGCDDATMIVGDDLFCDGRDGCFSAESVEVNDNLYCDGYEGCQSLEVTMQTASTITMNGYRSAQSIDLTFADNLSGYAYVFVYGYRALFFSLAGQINSGLNNNIFFDMRGYEAGLFFQSFECQAGSTCEFNCVGYGCGTDMTVDCVETATCIKNCTYAISDDYCPTFVNITSSSIKTEAKKMKQIPENEEIDYQKLHHHEAIVASIPDHREYTKAMERAETKRNRYKLSRESDRQNIEKQMQKHKKQKNKNRNQLLKNNNAKIIVNNNHNAKNIKNNYIWIVISGTVILLISVWAGLYSCIVKKRVENPHQFVTTYQSI